MINNIMSLLDHFSDSIGIRLNFAGEQSSIVHKLFHVISNHP